MKKSNEHQQPTTVKKTDPDLNKKQILKETLWNTFNSAPYVFKKLHVYFAFYYIPFALAALFLAYRFLFPPDLERERGMFSSLLSFLGIAFTVFITPYYTRQYNEKYGKQSFWDFVRENVNPLVINHIKVFFVILLYIVPGGLAIFLGLILGGLLGLSNVIGNLPVLLKSGNLTNITSLGLIIYCIPFFIPGIVKMIRLMFVTQTTFFDRRCHEQSLSALKASEELTKGSFWFLTLLFVSLYLIVSLPKVLLQLVFAEFSDPFSAAFLMGSFNFLLHFYLYNLTLIFWVQLYFCLRKAKSL